MITFEHFVSCPGHFLLSIQFRTCNVIFHYIKYLYYKNLSWLRPSPMVTMLLLSSWLRCSSTPGYDAPRRNHKVKRSAFNYDKVNSDILNLSMHK